MDDLRNELNVAIAGGNQKEVTACRGRLIKKLKSSLKNADNENEKKEIEQELEQVLQEHKAQLDGRYASEYKNLPKSILSLVTVLPKGVGLSVKKVAACIDEQKLAKTEKEKKYASEDLWKSIGTAAITPLDYTARFAARHWYLAAFGVTRIPKVKDFFVKLLDEKFKIKNQTVTKTITKTTTPGTANPDVESQSTGPDINMSEEEIQQEISERLGTLNSKHGGRIGFDPIEAPELGGRFVHYNGGRGGQITKNGIVNRIQSPERWEFEKYPDNPTVEPDINDPTNIEPITKTTINTSVQNNDVPFGEVIYNAASAALLIGGEVATNQISNEIKDTKEAKRKH